MDVGYVIEPDLSNVPDGYRIRLKTTPPSTNEKFRYGVVVTLEGRRSENGRKMLTFWKTTEVVYWVFEADESVYLENWDEVRAVAKIESAVETLIKKYIPEVPEYDKAQEFVSALNDQHLADPKRKGKTHESYQTYF